MSLRASLPAQKSERKSWQKIARRVRVPLGFVFVVAFLLLARPTPLSLGTGLPFIAAGLALRSYAAGYLTKNRQLSTSGPYAYVRNPLYLGTGLMTAGFAITSLSPVVAAALIAMFLAIYLPTIASEELYLREKFSEFDAYAASVPRLLPRLTPARFGGEGGFVRAVYLKNREYQALMGASAVYIALVARVLLTVHH